MTWLKLIGLVLKIILAIATFLRDRQLIDAGTKKAISNAQEKNNARVEKARAARRAAGADVVQDDDPYLRD